ncbi:helix-turn-helix domain-containing protein [Reyranella sp.]|uniref:helix-turn-helix domain-containing protein n=1 Tax=Reyranella sp. TaxID=1929291 RepID=UPI003784B410
MPKFNASEDPLSVVDRHVATRMRERRIQLGMTQQRFAEAIGMTYQQVSKYEAGRNRVAAGSLYRIAQALDVDIGYFFEGLDQTAGQRVHHPSGRRSRRTS